MYPSSFKSNKLNSICVYYCLVLLQKWQIPIMNSQNVIEPTSLMSKTWKILSPQIPTNGNRVKNLSFVIPSTELSLSLQTKIVYTSKIFIKSLQKVYFLIFDWKKKNKWLNVHLLSRTLQIGCFLILDSI